MSEGNIGLEQELQTGLDQWIKDEGKISELVTKLGLEPMKLSLLELYALSKMAKMPLTEFIDGLISQWPDYKWIDELAEELPQVLSYLKRSTKSKKRK